ncbi:MAG: hypothetical protein R3C44_22230 [Chloroflexota bacterium]
MKRVSALLIPLVVLILSACSAVKLSPQMSHQGQLLDSSGNPVADGNYEVEYVLFHSATGGTGVYTETQTIAVENGLFTTSLGLSDYITPTLFAEPTWLQISVEGETLAPRQRLQGAPYAFSLTSGAVVQGAESIDSSPGAALTVWNTDASATGGAGLLVYNNANPLGGDRADVSALAVRGGGSVDDDNAANDTGGYAAVIDSQGYRGMLVSGGETSDGTSGYYAAVFDGPAGIYITGGGNCSGCTMAYIARNIGNTPINSGDFVAVVSVELDEEFNIPVMQVRRAINSDESVIGVATSAVSREPAKEVYGVQAGGYDRAVGAAGTGEYLNVAVQGLVQARAAGNTTLQPGTAVSVNADGVIATDGVGLARAMSAVDSNGMVWVMVGGPAGQ